jgi:hypothetical protein
MGAPLCICYSFGPNLGFLHAQIHDTVVHILINRRKRHPYRYVVLKEEESGSVTIVANWIRKPKSYRTNQSGFGTVLLTSKTLFYGFLVSHFL